MVADGRNDIEDMPKRSASNLALVHVSRLQVLALLYAKLKLKLIESSVEATLATLHSKLAGEDKQPRSADRGMRYTLVCNLQNNSSKIHSIDILCIII
jgi:hypothetical protein